MGPEEQFMDLSEHIEEHPDRHAAWESMNSFGGREKMISEAVFGCWPEAFGDTIELLLAELYMRAFVAGSNHGRHVTYRAFVGDGSV